MADTDPEALEREIERTRAELARTVDAIADRVSPKRVAQRGVARVKANVENALASVQGTIAQAQHGDVAGDGSGDGRPPYERPETLAPVLIAVGAAVVVTAAFVVWRRRRR
ncbi:DUF3618 domain-containing protein [Bailinhaonella thermotolerans]|uniref:DUF3618 domain-containing protein n=1 Tax=Bailinhaonella thermotolerans TaxID=1070861 RepID=A0A3A4BMS5_9ACTN|nr:DUF3618 domain-containing protein [Bailinhaonella thermotolerans]RJL32384.1 DUF3618 domain-containing protein [Bailinhaonella thermotolerans]